MEKYTDVSGNRTLFSELLGCPGCIRCHGLFKLFKKLQRPAKGLRTDNGLLGPGFGLDGKARDASQFENRSLTYHGQVLAYPGKVGILQMPGGNNPVVM